MLLLLTHSYFVAAAALLPCAVAVVAQRELHLDEVHEIPPATALDGELPPWVFPSDAVPTSSGISAVFSSEDDASGSTAGIQACPNSPSVQGYLTWTSMIQDIETTNTDERKEPYALCPNIRYDATGTLLHIQHYFTKISCAGVNCVVVGADVRVDKHLKGVQFDGVEFASLASPIVIGADTHALFSRCTIRDSIFTDPGLAPIVTFGHTFVQTSGFLNNIGHGGAILAAEHTLHVDTSAFINNTASNWADSGAAIQVGETDKSMAAIIVTDSCFDANTGANVVLVTSKSYVSLTEGNTVFTLSDRPVFCEGTYRLVNETYGECLEFGGVGDTCQTLFASLAAAPVASVEGTAADDPSRPLETDQKDWDEGDINDPLAAELASMASMAAAPPTLWMVQAVVAAAVLLFVSQM